MFRHKKVEELTLNNECLLFLCPIQSESIGMVKFRSGGGMRRRYSGWQSTSSVACAPETASASRCQAPSASRKGKVSTRGALPPAAT